MCNNNYKCENRHKNTIFHHLYNFMIGYSFTFIRWCLSTHFSQNEPLFQNVFYKLPYAFGTRLSAHDLLTWPLTRVACGGCYYARTPSGEYPLYAIIAHRMRSDFSKRIFFAPRFSLTDHGVLFGVASAKSSLFVKMYAIFKLPVALSFLKDIFQMSFHLTPF